LHFLFISELHKIIIQNGGYAPFVKEVLEVLKVFPCIENIIPKEDMHLFHVYSTFLRDDHIHKRYMVILNFWNPKSVFMIT